MSEKWLYQGKIKSIQTSGGHQRIPKSEIERLLPRKVVTDSPELRRRISRRVSGRNQLFGRVTHIKICHLRLSFAGQHITSIIPTDEVRELRLKNGQTAIALIKSTEVVIIRLG